MEPQRRPVSPDSRFLVDYGRTRGRNMSEADTAANARQETVAEPDARPTRTSRSYRARRVLRTFVVICLTAGTVTLPSVAVAGGSDTLTEELIARYAPILNLRQQAFPCDAAGEPYDAAPAGIVLGDPAVVLRRNVPGQPIVM